jgi:uncharacterized RDD family membrane protein YckC
MTATVVDELPVERDQTTQYAGFWLRLKAGLVDFLVFLPVALLWFWAPDWGRGAAVAYSVVSNILYFAYSIVGHAIWGQTLGKRVTRIRVVDVSGRPIGWRQAVRRSSVDIALGAITTIAYAWVIFRIPAAEFETLRWLQVQERYDAIRPAWVVATEYAYWAWLASEVVSVLFNKRRRALHDFIAGTVVVREAQGPSGLGAPAVQGWRRALSIADTVLAAVALVAAVFFALGALAPLTARDPSHRPSMIAVAAYSAILAFVYALAARSIRRESQSMWLLHALALVLTCLPFIPFFIDTPAVPEMEPPPPGGGPLA